MLKMDAVVVQFLRLENFSLISYFGVLPKERKTHIGGLVLTKTFVSSLMLHTKVS